MPAWSRGLGGRGSSGPWGRHTSSALLPSELPWLMGCGVWLSQRCGPGTGRACPCDVCVLALGKGISWKLIGKVLNLWSAWLWPWQSIYSVFYGGGRGTPHGGRTRWSLSGPPACKAPLRALLLSVESSQEWVSGDQWLPAPGDLHSLCSLGLTFTNWKRGGESGLFFLNHHFCSTTEQNRIVVQAQ